jgi:hypothetical protein
MFTIKPHHDISEDDEYGRCLEQIYRIDNNLKIDGEFVKDLIISLAKNQERGVGSQMTRFMKHLLKWIYQPQKRTRSWAVSINNSRDEIEDFLVNQKTLSDKVESDLTKLYSRAKRQASGETGLVPSSFPYDCPWTLDDILNTEVDQLSMKLIINGIEIKKKGDT